MTAEEIQIRQIANQHLLSPGEKNQVARDLLGFQAQFMGNALHAMKIRCRDFDENTCGDGLVKNWSIRGTMHVFSREDLPLFINCRGGKDYRRNEWHEPNFWNQREKWALTPGRQQEISKWILSALADGPKNREALKEICLNRGMTQEEAGSMFDSWGGGIRLLCQRGFMHYAAQEKKILCLSPEFAPISEKDAETEMLRRYFTHYGPATLHDAMYFFHETAANIKKRLDELPLLSVQSRGRTYYSIENPRSCDLQMPACLFLAGFDPLLLGYEKKESLHLHPDDIRGIFSPAGIVMPSLMLSGRIIGKWKRENKRLKIFPFRVVSPREKAVITEKAEMLWPEIKEIDFVP